MYIVGQDNRMHRCLTTLETQIVLKELHERVVGGHFAPDIITTKILDASITRNLPFCKYLMQSVFSCMRHLQLQIRPVA